MQHLLLLHGALGHAPQFDELKTRLEESYTIHIFNFAGHGGRQVPDGLSIHRFAEETAELINTAIGGSVSIFGHSMGGYVALYMARHSMAPIEKIMTLGTKLDWNPQQAGGESKMLNTEKMKEKVPAFAQQLAHIHGGENWELLCSRTADMMLEMGENPPLAAEDFGQIAIPVQLGLGDRDRMVSLEETIAAYRKLPAGRLLVLPATPHPYEQVNAARLAYEVKGFV